MPDSSGYPSAEFFDTSSWKFGVVARQKINDWEDWWMRIMQEK